MAEMDPRARLVVLLTPGARIQGQGGALRPGVRPTRREEASGAGCQEARAAKASLTILDISLPPKHLTYRIRQHTNKQTDTHHSHKHADAEGCLES